MRAPSSIDMVGIVVVHTPTYVWLLLGAAVMLGARRLKPRRRHLAIAALPPALFIAIGLWFAASVEAPFLHVAVIWTSSFGLGAATSRLRLVPRPKRVRGLLFDFPPSPIPIMAYLCIFSVHYGLGTGADSFRTFRSASGSRAWPYRGSPPAERVPTSC